MANYGSSCPPTVSYSKPTFSGYKTAGNSWDYCPLPRCLVPSFPEIPTRPAFRPDWPIARQVDLTTPHSYWLLTLVDDTLPHWWPWWIAIPDGPPLKPSSNVTQQAVWPLEPHCNLTDYGYS